MGMSNHEAVFVLLVSRHIFVELDGSFFRSGGGVAPSFTGTAVQTGIARRSIQRGAFLSISHSLIAASLLPEALYPSIAASSSVSFPAGPVCYFIHV